LNSALLPQLAVADVARCRLLLWWKNM